MTLSMISLSLEHVCRFTVYKLRPILPLIQRHRVLDRSVDKNVITGDSNEINFQCQELAMGLYWSKESASQRPSERPKTKFCLERVTPLIPGFMVQGAISYGNWSSIVFLESNVNNQDYSHIVLEPIEVPYLQQLETPVFNRIMTDLIQQRSSHVPP